MTAPGDGGGRRCPMKVARPEPPWPPMELRVGGPPESGERSPRAGPSSRLQGCRAEPPRWLRQVTHPHPPIAPCTQKIQHNGNKPWSVCLPSPAWWLWGGPGASMPRGGLQHQHQHQHQLVWAGAVHGVGSKEVRDPRGPFSPWGRAWSSQPHPELHSGGRAGQSLSLHGCVCIDRCTDVKLYTDTHTYPYVGIAAWQGPGPQATPVPQLLVLLEGSHINPKPPTKPHSALKLRPPLPAMPATSHPLPRAHRRLPPCPASAGSTAAPQDAAPASGSPGEGPEGVGKPLPRLLWALVGVRMVPGRDGGIWPSTSSMTNSRGSPWGGLQGPSGALELLPTPGRAGQSRDPSVSAQPSPWWPTSHSGDPAAASLPRDPCSSMARHGTLSSSEPKRVGPWGQRSSWWHQGGQPADRPPASLPSRSETPKNHHSGAGSQTRRVQHPLPP